MAYKRTSSEPEAACAEIFRFAFTVLGTVCVKQTISDDICADQVPPYKRTASADGADSAEIVALPN